VNQVLSRKFLAIKRVSLRIEPQSPRLTSSQRKCHLLRGAGTGGSVRVELSVRFACRRQPTPPAPQPAERVSRRLSAPHTCRPLLTPTRAPLEARPAEPVVLGTAWMDWWGREGWALGFWFLGLVLDAWWMINGGIGFFVGFSLIWASFLDGWINARCVFCCFIITWCHQLLLDTKKL
jgi:hypothetical protein